MTKGKLLFINGNQFGYSAGHYYYCKYLREQFDIHYVCFDRGRKKVEMSNVNVHYVSFHGNPIKRIARFLFTGIKISRRLRPDLLFVVYFNLSFINALFCKAKHKILDIRSGSLALNPVGRKIENYYIKFQSLLFNRIVILSESLRQKLTLKNKDLLILPLGAEIFNFESHNFNIPHLLYVGTLHKRNLHETIDGLGIFFKRAPEFRSKIKYTIVAFGSNEEEEKVKESIIKNKLSENVVFVGRKNYDELPPYFQMCNVGVAYTPITDYFNCQPVTKIFEYSLSGLFTIATGTEENRLYINSDNGIICNDNPESFADAIEKFYLLKDGITHDKVQDSLRKYHWESIVKDILLPFLK